MKENIHVPMRCYYEAYYDFRKHCRDSKEQQAFEEEYAVNLTRMRDEVVSRKLDLGASSAFVVKKPKPREVFAGSVKKRILDTLCVRLLKPYMDGKFSYRQYNVRKGFGLTQYQEQLQADMREAAGKLRDPYVLGLDVKSFFMDMRKEIIWKLWEEVILEWYDGPYKRELLYIMYEIVWYEPEKHCVIKGNRDDWRLIPPHKSLFTNGKDKGMPIGDLVSQYSALLMMRRLVLWMECRYHYTALFMDDFYIIGEHTELLKTIPLVRQKLSEVELSLNEKKTYLQPIRHGIKSCGTVVYPDRAYVSNRVVRDAVQRMLFFNDRIRGDPSELCQSMNSYFGILRHFRTYNIRKTLVRMVPPEWWNKIYIKGHYEIFKIKKHGSKRNLSESRLCTDCGHGKRNDGDTLR